MGGRWREVPPGALSSGLQHVADQPLDVLMAWVARHETSRGPRLEAVLRRILACRKELGLRSLCYGLLAAAGPDRAIPEFTETCLNTEAPFDDRIMMARALANLDRPDADAALETIYRNTRGSSLRAYVVEALAVFAPPSRRVERRRLIQRLVEAALASSRSVELIGVALHCATYVPSPRLTQAIGRHQSDQRRTEFGSSIAELAQEALRGFQ